MSEAPQTSDALVFFGATGDLAFKQIFPALLKLVQRHDLHGICGYGIDRGSTFDQ